MKKTIELDDDDRLVITYSLFGFVIYTKAIAAKALRQSLVSPVSA